MVFQEEGQSTRHRSGNKWQKERTWLVCLGEETKIREIISLLVGAQIWQPPVKQITFDFLSLFLAVPRELINLLFDLF